jgi:uncharacterized protein (TIGR02266 family)
MSSRADDVHPSPSPQQPYAPLLDGTARVESPVAVAGRAKAGASSAASGPSSPNAANATPDTLSGSTDAAAVTASSPPQSTNTANASADRASLEPHPPDSAQTHRRSYERFPVEVSVDFVSEHNFFTGFSLNVSEGGLFVATHQARGVGSKIAIRLALPDSMEPLELLTEVRWVREHNVDSDASPGLGLRFIDLSKDAEARIHAFVRRGRDPLFYDDD